MTEVNTKVEINPKKYKLRGWIRVASAIVCHVNVYQTANSPEEAKKFASTIAEFLELEKLSRDIETMFDFWEKMPDLRKLQIPDVEIESNGKAVPSCGIHINIENPLWEAHKNLRDAPFYYISFEYERGGWSITERSFNLQKTVPPEAHELARRIHALKDEL